MDEIPAGYKRCKKCGEIKLKDEFYDHATAADGKRGECKVCSRHKSKTNREKDPERHRQYCRDWRVENIEYARQRERDYNEKNREKRREGYRRHYYENQEAKIEEKRRIRRERPEYAREIQRRSYWKNWEKRRFTARQNVAKNRENRRLYNRKYRQANRERLIEQDKQYRRTKRGLAVARAAAQRYKARKRNLPNTLTTDQWLRCRDYWHDRCAVCECLHHPRNPICADHFIPISYPDCPGTTVGNIICLCRVCNVKKNNQEMRGWLINTYGLEQAQVIFQRILDYFDWVKYQDSN